MYAQLLQQLESMDAEGRAKFRTGASALRYTASGMAALPASTSRRWAEASGHVLLELYGTTETGLALSNRVPHEESGSRRRGVLDASRRFSGSRGPSRAPGLLKNA